MAELLNGKTIRELASLLAISVLLSGCLGSEEEPVARTSATASILLEGSVGDGPIINAGITVSGMSGAVLASDESDETARYAVLVNADASEYPLIVSSRGGLDLVTNGAPDFELLGVAVAPGVSTVANVNPYTTFVSEVASAMNGGINAETIARAEIHVETVINFGLVSLRANDALTTAIDETNVSEIIKASETLGEAVRRVRDRLVQTGRSATGDSVIRAIASDLVDGKLDGIGGSRVEPRTSALMTVVGAEVLLEAMQNELFVNGVDASQAMSDAAAIVNGGAPSIGIEDLLVNAPMIRIAMEGLQAGQAISPDTRLQSLLNAVDGLQDGMDAVLVRSVIPNDYRSITGSLADFVTSASDAEINTLNAARGGALAPGGQANRAPSISGQPQTSVVVSEAYQFRPTASDADGDMLSFIISGQPAWSSFDASTGRLSGTPQSGDVGAYTDIVIRVTDGSATTSLPAFTLNVLAEPAGNVAPTISGSPPASVVATQNYQFQPTASDADGDSLSFNISNLPGWLSFNPNNGVVSGTPTEASVGTYTDITIRVTDGTSMTSLPSFSIEVLTSIIPNSRPTISGAPASSINVGANYSFTPGASDPDGDSLTFTVSGLPSWAQFDGSSGRLSGTPGDADVGTYSNIVITVSDGEDTASLAPFSIIVNAISLGSATLSWSAPTQNDDGSALTDLAGYRLYWGTSAGSYTESLTIDNPGQTTAVIENLAPATYVFVATAFNAAGIESTFSNTATKVVQ